MSNYSAILEPFKGRSSRYTCPSCNSRFEFARYINAQTGEHVADHVGRCNREVNCGYHYTPKQHYEDNKHLVQFSSNPNQFNQFRTEIKPIKPIKPIEPIDFLPSDVFEKSLKRYKSNFFFDYIESLFGDDLGKALMAKYSVGTSIRWPGANVFWQIDFQGTLRQAKVMLYNPQTGRRVKDVGDGRDAVFFAGKSILKNYEANLSQCFFGEVLLSLHPEKTVAIVESEKTAIIASIYFPDLVWIATGGSHGCRWTSLDVCKVLRGRQVVLFPDLGFFNKWSDKAEEVKKLTGSKIIVSDLLERHATDEQRQSSLDLADYLLMNRDSAGWAMTADEYPLMWDVKSLKS